MKDLATLAQEALDQAKESLARARESQELARAANREAQASNECAKVLNDGYRRILAWTALMIDWMETAETRPHEELVARARGYVAEIQAEVRKALTEAAEAKFNKEKP